MDPAQLTLLASRAWPTVRVDPARFLAYVAQHDAGRALSGEPEGDDAAARAAELWLACAIADGDDDAARAFDERYMSALDRTLARMKLASAVLDDVKQLVREKLLVRDETGIARIEAYAGQGKLEGLVQVVATREALSLLRKTERETPTDADLAGPLVGPVDPALEPLKGRTAAAFRVAFADAVGSLEPKERNLLRMHLLGGVTLEHLAKVHDVHRATIVRWLRDARERVLARTKASLAARLEVRADEIESLMGLAESRLDVSLDRLLRSTHDPDDASF